MNPQPLSKIIDVAAGTGDLARMASKKNDNKNRFCCVEPNMEMFATGKEKLRNLSNIKWATLDTCTPLTLFRNVVKFLKSSETF